MKYTFLTSLSTMILAAGLTCCGEDKQNDRLESKVEDKDRELEAKERELAQQQQEVRRLKEDAAEQAATAKRLQDKIGELRNQVHSVKGKQDERHDKLSQLFAQLKSSKADNAEQLVHQQQLASLLESLLRTDNPMLAHIQKHLHGLWTAVIPRTFSVDREFCKVLVYVSGVTFRKVTGCQTSPEEEPQLQIDAGFFRAYRFQEGLYAEQVIETETLASSCAHIKGFMADVAAFRSFNGQEVEFELIEKQDPTRTLSISRYDHSLEQNEFETCEELLKTTNIGLSLERTACDLFLNATLFDVGASKNGVGCFVSEDGGSDFSFKPSPVTN